MLLTVTQDTGQPPKKTYLTQNVSPAKLEKLCATTIIKYRKKQGMELSLTGKNLCCFKYQKNNNPYKRSVQWTLRLMRHAVRCIMNQGSKGLRQLELLDKYNFHGQVRRWQQRQCLNCNLICGSHTIHSVWSSQPGSLNIFNTFLSILTDLNRLSSLSLVITVIPELI